MSTNPAITQLPAPLGGHLTRTMQRGSLFSLGQPAACAKGGSMSRPDFLSLTTTSRLCKRGGPMAILIEEGALTSLVGRWRVPRRCRSSQPQNVAPGTWSARGWSGGVARWKQSASWPRAARCAAPSGHFCKAIPSSQRTIDRHVAVTLPRGATDQVDTQRGFFAPVACRP